MGYIIIFIVALALLGIIGQIGFGVFLCFVFGLYLMLNDHFWIGLFLIGIGLGVIIR